MPSSYTSRNRFNKQGTGDAANTWGVTWNASGGSDLLDTALDGWTVKAITGDVTLTSVNGAADEARSRVLKFTGSTAATVTIPGLEKWYVVWNASSATITIASQGGGSTAAVLAGEIVFVACDAVNVKRLTLLSAGSNRLQNVSDPTNAQDAATKAYVDATAWTYNAGSLPAQSGNAGKFIKTDGSTASWTAVASTDLSDLATFIATRRAEAIAFATAL